MLLSPEIVVIVGAFVVSVAGATLLLCTGLEQAVLPGSKNMRKWNIGVPQELGRSCRFRSKIPAGDTGKPTPGLSRRRVARRERNDPRHLRYRQAKETKRGGMGGRKSQRLDSIDEAGELIPEDPVERSEASGHDTAFGKHGECLEIRQACSRNNSG
jgi:hypothetical protein